MNCPDMFGAAEFLLFKLYTYYITCCMYLAFFENVRAHVPAHVIFTVKETRDITETHALLFPTHEREILVFRIPSHLKTIKTILRACITRPPG